VLLKLEEPIVYAVILSPVIEPVASDADVIVFAVILLAVILEIGIVFSFYLFSL
jgi:hypothetical protein